MNTIEPKARASDPETSHSAAASVTKLGEKQQLVLRVVTYCTKDSAYASGITLEELTDLYPGFFGTEFNPQFKQSESGIRTRLKELSRLGLVEDSGLRRKTRSGRAAIVWRIRA